MSSGYRTTLRRLSAAIIDEAGPITFKHLSEIIARQHGFQRTGRQIKSQVWAAAKDARKHTADPDGQKVFWPEGAEPADIVSFRGLAPGGHERGWRDVPHPKWSALPKRRSQKAVIQLNKWRQNWD